MEDFLWDAAAMLLFILLVVLTLFLLNQGSVS